MRKNRTDLDRNHSIAPSIEQLLEAPFSSDNHLEQWRVIVVVDPASRSSLRQLFIFLPYWPVGRTITGETRFTRPFNVDRKPSQVGKFTGGTDD
jgi:hypothetical protein